MRFGSYPPGPSLIFAFASVGLALVAQAAGCGGGGSNTSQSVGGVGGVASSSSTTGTSSSGKGTSSSSGATSSSSGAASSSSSSSGFPPCSPSSSSSSSGGGPNCGNGTLDPGEQCDDGNHLDLDGCDSSCRYEMVARMTQVSISSSAAPSFCASTTNALGTQVITNVIVLGELNSILQMSVSSGTLDILMQFLGLSDLTGTNANGFDIGVVNGSLDPAKGTWPGTSPQNSPIDWWYLADHTTLSMGLPTGQFTCGTIANHTLSAGPSTVSLALNFAGQPAVLQMAKARLAAAIGAPTDTPMPPPTTLPSGFQVMETIDATATNQGLCGNITAASLSQIPVPATLTSGMFACQASCPTSFAYTPCTGTQTPQNSSCNSLLDVIVGGCGVTPLGSCLQAVNATQPDVAANGTVMALSLDATTHKVTQNVANDNDGYSAYLQFAANRGHFTGETCAVTSDCQTGKTCPAGGGTCM